MADDKKKAEEKKKADGPVIWNINDLEKEGKELSIPKDTQQLNWKINSSPSTVEDKDALKKMLTNPPVKKIDLYFPLGIEITARNMKGVTIKDALDAIHKSYKKRTDDELEEPYLAGFEWDKTESWTKLKVHLKKEGGGGGGKKKKKAAAEE